MNLSELRNAGAFVPSEPVKVAVAWKEYTFDVYVRRMAFGDVEALFSGAAEGRSARLIAAAILLGEDREPITFEDACRLDVSLAAKLVEAFNEVNQAGKV